MTFTDDNKKQVEEVLRMSSGKTMEISKWILVALLARLEAAEACLEVPHMKHTEECIFCSRYIAWRKTCGRTEK